jgi:hypothetical protein
MVQELLPLQSLIHPCIDAVKGLMDVFLGRPERQPDMAGTCWAETASGDRNNLCFMKQSQ